MNFQNSLSHFSIFEIATPNLISIILYLSIIRFRITPSNTILFFLGLLNDIINGDNLGIFSFCIVFLMNLVMNFAVPQMSPIFFHIGITLILFPVINISLIFFSFVTRLIKS